MTQRNRPRRLLADFAIVGLIGGALIWLLAGGIAGGTSGSIDTGIYEAAHTVAYNLAWFGAISLVGYLVVRAVQTDNEPQKPQRAVATETGRDWYADN